MASDSDVASTANKSSRYEELRVAITAWVDLSIKLLALGVSLCILLGGFFVWRYLDELGLLRFFRSVIATTDSVIVIAFVALLTVVSLASALVVGPLAYQAANTSLEKFRSRFGVSGDGEIGWNDLVVLCLMLAVPALLVLADNYVNFWLCYIVAGLVLLVGNGLVKLRKLCYSLPNVKADSLDWGAASKDLVGYFALFGFAFLSLFFPLWVAAVFVDGVDATLWQQILLFGVVLAAYGGLAWIVTRMKQAQTVTLVITLVVPVVLWALAMSSPEMVARSAGLGGYPVKVWIDAEKLEGNRRLSVLRESCGAPEKNKGRTIETCATLLVSTSSFLILEVKEHRFKIPSGLVLYQELRSPQPNESVEPTGEDARG